MKTSGQRVQNGSDLSTRALILFLACGIMAWTARWVSLYAIGSVVLWGLLAGRKDLWSRATAPFLASAATGLIGLTMFVFVLNFMHLVISPDTLRELEYHLIAARLALKSSVTFAAIPLLVISVALIVLNAKAPRTHVIRIWLWS